LEGCNAGVRPTIAQVNQQTRKETRLLYLQKTHTVPVIRFPSWAQLLTPHEAARIKELCLGQACACAPWGHSSLDLLPVLQFAVNYPTCSIEVVTSCTNDSGHGYLEASSHQQEKHGDTTLGKTDTNHPVGADKSRVHSTNDRAREALQDVLNTVRRSREWCTVIKEGLVVEVRVNADVDVCKLVYQDCRSNVQTQDQRRDLWLEMASLPGCEDAIVEEAGDGDTEVDTDSEDEDCSDDA
jgi:hypothetical protein